MAAAGVPSPAAAVALRCELDARAPTPVEGAAAAAAAARAAAALLAAGYAAAAATRAAAHMALGPGAGGRCAAAAADESAPPRPGESAVLANAFPALPLTRSAAADAAAATLSAHLCGPLHAIAAAFGGGEHLQLSTHADGTLCAPVATGAHTGTAAEAAALVCAALAHMLWLAPAALLPRLLARLRPLLAAPPSGGGRGAHAAAAVLTRGAAARPLSHFVGALLAEAHQQAAAVDAADDGPSTLAFAAAKAQGHVGLGPAPHAAVPEVYALLCAAPPLVHDVLTHDGAAAAPAARELLAAMRVLLAALRGASVDEFAAAVPRVTHAVHATRAAAELLCTRAQSEHRVRCSTALAASCRALAIDDADSALSTAPARPPLHVRPESAATAAHLQQLATACVPLQAPEGLQTWAALAAAAAPASRRCAVAALSAAYSDALTTGELLPSTADSLAAAASLPLTRPLLLDAAEPFAAGAAAILAVAGDAAVAAALRHVAVAAAGPSHATVAAALAAATLGVGDWQGALQRGCRAALAASQRPAAEAALLQTLARHGAERGALPGAWAAWHVAATAPAAPPPPPTLAALLPARLGRAGSLSLIHI